MTLGARYSYNKSRNNVEVWQYGTFIPDQQKTSSDKTSYKASLNWKLDDNNFLYALVSSGYKPGGLNVPVGIGQPAAACAAVKACVADTASRTRSFSCE